MLDFGRIRLLAAIAAGLASAAQSRAQPPAPLEFEVASIKPRPVAPGAMMVTFRHGTLNVDIARLRQIIGLAYGIQRVRVQGGPSWLDTEQYVIAAKAESADASWDQVRTMLQTLLARAHREKTGPKLQEAKEGEKTDATQGRGPSGAQMTFQKMPIGGLVNTLANTLGSPALDKTALKGE